jgi:uncharacterized protein YbjT (DUF2867 family)
MAAQRNIITLFGGTGFLGRHIVQALAKTGAQIRIATRSPASAYFLKPCGDVGQITPVSCNLHDAASVARALAGSTHVINLVGILFESGRISTFDNLHHLAAQRIAQAAGEAGVRQLIHVSAIGASAQAASNYARSKAAGEAAVRRAFVDAIILRPSLVFGPEDDFFNRFARMARLSPLLPLVMGGKTRFQPVYVGDIAQAILKLVSCTEVQKHAGKTFELAGPQIMTFRALLELMLQITGRERSFMPLPAPIAKAIGVFGALCPTPPLTVDQVRSLAEDNVASGGLPGLADLGVAPTAMGGILPLYLAQYRKTA